MTIRTSGVNFKGIYGGAMTSTGKIVPLKIENDDSYSFKYYCNDSEGNKVYEIKSKDKRFEVDGDDLYKDIEIYKVTGNSTVSLTQLNLRIAELKDNAKVMLDKSLVHITKISGDNVTLDLRKYPQYIPSDRSLEDYDTYDTGFTVEENSDSGFNVKGVFSKYENDNARITGNEVSYYV